MIQESTKDIKLSRNISDTKEDKSAIPLELAFPATAGKRGCLICLHHDRLPMKNP
jgi:hypothetical protein